jgi:hypothetical protein
MKIYPERRKGLISMAIGAGLCVSLFLQCPMLRSGFWDAQPEDPESIPDCADEFRMAEKINKIGQRLDRKFVVIDALIEEELTLPAAVDQFMLINVEGEDQRDIVRLFFPSGSLRESTRLQVLQFLKARINHHKNRDVEEVMARVVAEEPAGATETIAARNLKGLD